MSTAQPVTGDPTLPIELDELTVRFAGDSGDGMQVTGSQFTVETAVAGNQFATFPDFPAEIRAPVGTTFGVSAFQIRFGSSGVRTEGDDVDVLVAFNPAALITNLSNLKRGGLLIVNRSTFNARNLQKAGYENNPLEDDSLAPYVVLAIDIEKLALDAVADCGVSNKEAHRTKNFWALGLILWVCDLKRDAVLEWMQSKFAAMPNVLAANVAALNAGHAYGETNELAHSAPRYSIAPAKPEPGLYRDISGTEALCLGLVTEASLFELPVTYCSYPITPASAMLHSLTKMNAIGVRTFQAEDEIAAICAAIGASYAGDIGVTGTSGPGMALKGEALGLAIATELPLVVVNAQRGGPSTGLPTKTEQSDLYQAVVGRNADAPLVVIAARSASDCFDSAREAVRLAIKFMTPVILLTDGYIANAAEPWRTPDIRNEARHQPAAPPATEAFQPYQRDPVTRARPWVAPGTPDLHHRIGGIERAAGSGNISYDPANHQQMTNERFAKIAAVANEIPEQTFEIGNTDDDVLVIGWGSTFGAIYSAVEALAQEGKSVAYIHLRHLSPLPRNLRELTDRFERILVPELNAGQLVNLLRAEFGRDIQSLAKVEGQPFKTSELKHAINALLTD